MSFPDEGSTYAILRRSIRLTVTPAQVSLPAAFRTGTVAAFYPLDGTISITSLSFRLFPPTTTFTIVSMPQHHRRASHQSADMTAAARGIRVRFSLQMNP